MTGQTVADTCRALAVPVAAITAGISIRVVVDRVYLSGTQMFRFLGLAFVTSAVALGQYNALGRPPTWWVLIPLWIGLLLSLAGTLPLVRRGFQSESLRETP